uniref:Uncharacterized protein n=1 Tax=Pipistrellus kuhlii TaxID=59472 RepID=A0A7J7TW20_PIPKU|nr:hypothetical protein mPipKuh1_009237 [Pipistrellus kuhlii]
MRASQAASSQSWHHNKPRLQLRLPSVAVQEALPCPVNADPLTEVQLHSQCSSQDPSLQPTLLSLLWLKLLPLNRIIYNYSSLPRLSSLSSPSPSQSFKTAATPPASLLSPAAALPPSLFSTVTAPMFLLATHSPSISVQCHPSTPSRPLTLTCPWRSGH